MTVDIIFGVVMALMYAIPILGILGAFDRQPVKKLVASLPMARALPGKRGLPPRPLKRMSDYGAQTELDPAPTLGVLLDSMIYPGYKVIPSATSPETYARLNELKRIVDGGPPRAGPGYRAAGRNAGPSRRPHRAARPSFRSPGPTSPSWGPMGSPRPPGSPFSAPTM